MMSALKLPCTCQTAHVDCFISKTQQMIFINVSNDTFNQNTNPIQRITGNFQLRILRKCGHHVSKIVIITSSKGDLNDDRGDCYVNISAYFDRPEIYWNTVLLFWVFHSI